MKKNLRIGLLSILASFAVASCSDEGTAEDVLVTDPDIITDDVATIMLTEGGADDDIFYATAEGEAGGTVSGRVIFTTTTDAQKRMYITQTLPGGTPEPFEIPALSNKGTKADGSIDLDGDQTEDLDFTFDLNVPTSVEDGTIVYNFWTTSGRGDFRDSSKRLLIGVGTIEVSVGTGENPDAEVRTFGDVTLQLDAPLGDGSSNTFLSLLDGDIYTINQGSEVAALWDFGYYYGATGLASFASANDYPTNVFDILPVANANTDTDAGEETITEDDLNTCYFSLSTIFSSTDFDDVTNDSQLDVIVQSDSQRVNQLEEGDVVEFVDSYGTKGLIRVVSINPTNGSDGYITFDIKVQSYSAIDTSDL